MKYLIIRLGAIGDAVHSTIIAQAIKNKYPESEIHFLTADFIAPLIKYSPFIDKVIPFNMKNSNNIFYIIKMGLKFLTERYDIIFPLSNTTRNILMTYMAFPKKVVKRSKNRIHAVDAFYNTAADGLDNLNKPEKIILKLDNKLINSINNKIKDYPRPYYVFSPGGANDNARQGRIWYNKYWIELGNKLTEKYGGSVFICGSKGELDNHKQYAVIKNSKVFSGELSLEESAALYSMSDIFFSGDSGPLHIAACFDINIIALYGSTNPRNVSPYGHNNSCVVPSIDCKFCEKRVCDKLENGEIITPCMKSITPEMVLGFIEGKNLLSKTYSEAQCQQ